MSELQVDAESALLETVLYSSRAMRRLEPEPVPEALLLKLIDAANQAAEHSGAVRVVSLLEGGYDLNALAACVHAHIKSLIKAC